jgi:hypothetical protein
LRTLPGLRQRASRIRTVSRARLSPTAAEPQGKGSPTAAEPQGKASLRAIGIRPSRRAWTCRTHRHRLLRAADPPTARVIAMAMATDIPAGCPVPKATRSTGPSRCGTLRIPGTH